MLNDPRLCHFPAEQLACKAGQDPSTCLTALQVEAVDKIWSGPDHVVGPGYDPGIERGGETLGWPGFITGSAPGLGSHTSLGLPFFKYFIYDDPNWDFHTFNFATDAPIVDNKRVSGQTMAQVLNAVDPNLEPLKERGGKIIHYHGFSDPDIAPRNSINYFLSVVGAQAEIAGPRNALAETQDFYRLFMVPGMNHCGGGPGANSFDTLTALENWVERGQAPERIIASHFTNGTVAFSRPLCPYPKVAQWTGTGSSTDAANFVCTAEAGNNGNVGIALNQFSIQYSPSAVLSPSDLKSVTVTPRRLPWMPRNLPVPPVSVVTLVVRVTLDPSAAIVVCVIASQRPRIVSPFSSTERV